MTVSDVRASAVGAYCTCTCTVDFVYGAHHIIIEKHKSTTLELKIEEEVASFLYEIVGLLNFKLILNKLTETTTLTIKMSNNDDKAPLTSTGTSSMEILRVEKELYKEVQYMTLYKNLLRKNRDLFQQQRHAEDQIHFADEAALLKEAISSQRQIWFAGIGIGLLTFASLHYLPTYLIRSLGGEAKIKALNAAEAQARKDGTAWFRKATGKSP